MAMEPTDFGGLVPIDGYGPGFFRVRGQVHRGPLLMTPWSVEGWAGFEDTAPLLALAGRVDVLFLGMGSEIAPMPAPLRQALQTAGLMADAMATPTAARTYNVLLSEGRRVAAALLPVPAE
ncbi:Mth938-like domain-containing protein [Paracoccus pacificus]|uniref:Mth938-like domain-containing protein n=1 Tax=Paracoccus pacificus TaxID=1463598 RepID=A0ABW4R5C1_9RHOB